MRPGTGSAPSTTSSATSSVSPRSFSTSIDCALPCAPTAGEPARAPRAQCSATSLPEEPRKSPKRTSPVRRRPHRRGGRVRRRPRLRRSYLLYPEFRTRRQSRLRLATTPTFAPRHFFAPRARATATRYPLSSRTTCPETSLHRSFRQHARQSDQEPHRYARDILVGKVPDPKSQVEQITIALIYKFMDDMDASPKSWAAKRTFFVKASYAKYSVGKLLDIRSAAMKACGCSREHRADATRTKASPRAFPRHLQERLSALPRPRNAEPFLKTSDEFTTTTANGWATPSSICSPFSARRATRASSARRATSSTSWSRSSIRRRTRPSSTPPAAPRAS